MMLDIFRISFHYHDVDGCAAAVVEGEDGALVDVCSGDDESNQADEADRVVQIEEDILAWIC